MRLRAIAAVIVLVSSAPLAAQQCVAPERPYFEFQVNTPAAFVPDTSVWPRPYVRPVGQPISQPGDLIVQFVVDSAGVPRPSTFKILRSPTNEISEAVQAVFQRWRFTPALVGGCKVPQLFQTLVTTTR